MREVSADKAYSSKANLQAVANIDATHYVPFKDTPTGRVVDPDAPTPAPTAPAWDRMYHLFALQRDTFLAHYHVRSTP
jgi:hypothetical protein